MLLIRWLKKHGKKIYRPFPNPGRPLLTIISFSSALKKRTTTKKQPTDYGLAEGCDASVPWSRFVTFVWFPIGKVGVATPGCVNEVTDMECGRSEIDELIKEVSGGTLSRGLAPTTEDAGVLVSMSPSKRCFHPGRAGRGGLGRPRKASLCQLACPFTWCPLLRPEGWAELCALRQWHSLKL